MPGSGRTRPIMAAESFTPDFHYACDGTHPHTIHQCGKRAWLYLNIANSKKLTI